MINKQIGLKYSGAIAAALLLGCLAVTIDPGRVWASMRKMDARYIPALVLVYLLIFPVRGLRWKMLASPLGRMSWGVSSSLILIARMANNILPARAGELTRALMASSRMGISGTRAFFSMGADRMYDGAALFGLFSLSALFLGCDASAAGVTWASQCVLWAALALFALMAALAAQNPERSLGLISGALFALRVPSAIVDTAASVAQDVFFIARISFTFSLKSLAAIILSILAWSVEAVMFWLAMRAMGFMWATPMMALFVAAVVNIGIAVPTVPGDVGMFHASAVMALLLFGAPPEDAMSFALVVHIVEYISSTALGLLALAVMGLGPSAVKAAGAVKQPLEEN